MEQTTKAGVLRELFTTQLLSLIASLNCTRVSLLEVKSEVIKGNRHNDELVITVFHPLDGNYNIVVAISEEIIIFFDDFHNHYDSIPDERPLEHVVEGAINQIKTILTTDRITITKLLKGKGIFRRMLEVEHQGHKQVLENYSINFSGLLFFIPTRKVVTTTTFSTN